MITLCVDVLGLRGLNFSTPSMLNMCFFLSAASILLLSMSSFICFLSSCRSVISGSEPHGVDSYAMWTATFTFTLSTAVFSVSTFTLKMFQL